MRDINGSYCCACARLTHALQALVFNDVLSFGPFTLNVSAGAMNNSVDFFVRLEDYNAIIGFARDVIVESVGVHWADRHP
jgi:hypothetical protein